MKLTNTWVGYLDRTYQQIKDRVITLLQSKVPEITDHTESNLFVKMVGIWSGIAEMLGYYTDNKARESFLLTARLYKDAVLIAKSKGYNPHTYLAASVTLRFSVTAAVTDSVVIPIGTVAVNDDGLMYTTVSEGTIQAGQTYVDIEAVQHVKVLQLEIGTSDGTPNQSIKLVDKIEDGTGLLQVDGIAWTPVDTLAYSLPTDQHYVQTMDELGTCVIEFGNGTFGAIPPSGATLVLDYYSTEGESGNVAAGAISTMQVNITSEDGQQVSVTNLDRASGGWDYEDLTSIRSKVPRLMRTNNRAVTRKDYKDVTMLANGVANAGVSFDCGKDVSLYIVPNGGGTATQNLIDSVQAFMDDRHEITTNVVVKPAGSIRLLVSVDLKVQSNYRRTLAVSNLMTDILDFFSYDNQEVEGLFRVGDLYESMESVEGVDSTVVIKLVPVPTATALDNAVYLNWTRELTEGSTVTALWTIVMLDDTRYQLFEDGGYKGTFTVGDTYTDDNVVFTINSGNYSAGMSWQFYTYPYKGDIIALEEPSILSVDQQDITINATGGF